VSAGLLEVVGLWKGCTPKDAERGDYWAAIDATEQGGKGL